jgi:hypothetical protein
MFRTRWRKRVLCALPARPRDARDRHGSETGLCESTKKVRSHETTRTCNCDHGDGYLVNVLTIASGPHTVKAAAQLSLN